MKVLVKRNFRNVGNRFEVKGSPHPMHVPKGAILSIGPTPETPYQQLERADRDLVFFLNQADCLGLPTPENIARVNRELEEEKKRYAAK